MTITESLLHIPATDESLLTLDGSVAEVACARVSNTFVNNSFHTFERDGWLRCCVPFPFKRGSFCFLICRLVAWNFAMTGYPLKDYLVVAAVQGSSNLTKLW